MAYDIWLVPCNTSHVDKYKLLLQGLEERGHRVRMLCVDRAMGNIYRCLHQIEASGFPYEIVEVGHFEPDVPWYRQLRHRKDLRKGLERAIRANHMDAIILGFDGNVVGGTLVRTVNRMGIASILIPDGLVVPSQRSSDKLLRRIRNTVSLGIRRICHAGERGTSGTDAILLMNASGKKNFLRMGIPAERICIVGSPEYDKLAGDIKGKRVIDPATTYAKSGILPGRPVVLFAHQELGGLAEAELLKVMIKGARQCNATVLTKFHPRGVQYPQKWVDWAKKEGFSPQDVVFVRDEITSIEAVQICTVCVVMYSTIALEAMIADKPVILLQYLRLAHQLTYGQDYGAAIDVNSPDALEQAIVSAMTDDKVRAELRKNAHRVLSDELCGLDGRSVERSIQEIERVIEQGNQVAVKMSAGSCNHRSSK